ncbi:hypothetical protein IWQ56_005186 [Coemansia nantahalensis]|nr:hypothetical protein IWQ56_005186 [Coemansia nantahalensis]
MACRCERQESVVRCYEKCGDDRYYRRVKLGEKGQQQIYCSQRRRDEPADLPSFAATDDDDDEHAKKHDEQPKSAPPAAPRPPERRAGKDDRDRDADRALAADTDGAMAGAAIGTHLLVAAALAAAL